MLMLNVLKYLRGGLCVDGTVVTRLFYDIFK